MDIGFAVSYKKASDGSEKTLIPFSRVNSHMVPEDGNIFCSEPGICMSMLLQLAFILITAFAFLVLNFYTGNL